MSTYRMIARPSSSVVTMPFNFYNEAISFMQASKALGPSKPWKRGMQWCVSYPRPVEKAKYVKLDAWQKPFPLYNEWRSVEALYHLPVPAPLPKASVVLEEEYA